MFGRGCRGLGILIRINGDLIAAAGLVAAGLVAGAVLGEALAARP